VKSAKHWLGVVLVVLIGAVGVSRADEPSADKPGEKPAGDAAAVVNGFTKLHFAAMRGDVAEGKRLLESGADINAPQAEFRGAPLQYAASHGHLEFVQLLISHDAKVDSVDANGRTPLMWAAMKGHTKIVATLLDSGANIGQGNNGRWTPLHYSMSYGHDETSELLLKRGASDTLTNVQNKTPIDVKGTNVKKAEDKVPE
jgi:ankyrin repeat protein